LKLALLGREAAGGAVSLLVGLPAFFTCALIISAPFGESFFGPALQMAFAGVIIGTLVGGWFTGIPVHLYGPRASLAIVLAGGLASLGALTPVNFVAATALCSLLTGVLLLVFGALRFGSLVRYVPYPVLAGFMSTVALAVILSQLPIALAGLLGAFPTRSDVLQPVGLAMVIFSFVACVLGSRTGRLAPPVWGLLLGTIVYHLTLWLTGQSAPAEHAVTSATRWWPESFVLAPIAGDLSLPLALLPVALTLATVSALESLMAAAGMQRVSGETLHANRDLVGLGATNVLVGLAGGMVTAGSPSNASAAYDAGARTRVGNAMHGLMLATILLVATPLLELIPVPVLVGVLLHAMVGNLRLWLVQPLMRQLRSARDDLQSRRESLLIPLVLVAGIAYGPTGAVLVGVGTAMVLFILLSSRSVVRGVHSGKSLRSSIQRDATRAALLTEHGERIRYIECVGPLFFGTADQLLREARPTLGADRVVVLDLERVTLIDASGAASIADFVHQARTSGTRLLFAGRDTLNAFRPALAAQGLEDRLLTENLFIDGDHALEHAESMLLGLLGIPATEDNPPMSTWGMLHGLSSEEIATLEARLQVFDAPKGTALFSQGEHIDTLYFIKRGAISVHLHDAKGIAHRLAAFQPGTVIGEIAFLEGGARSATAVADQDATVLMLTRDIFNTLEAEHPRIARRLIGNVAQEIARRLRVTTLSARRRMA